MLQFAGFIFDHALCKRLSFQRRVRNIFLAIADAQFLLSVLIMLVMDIPVIMKLSAFIIIHIFLKIFIFNFFMSCMRQLSVLILCIWAHWLLLPPKAKIADTLASTLFYEMRWLALIILKRIPLHFLLAHAWGASTYEWLPIPVAKVRVAVSISNWYHLRHAASFLLSTGAAPRLMPIARHLIVGVITY